MKNSKTDYVKAEKLTYVVFVVAFTLLFISITIMNEICRPKGCYNNENFHLPLSLSGIINEKYISVVGAARVVVFEDGTQIPLLSIGLYELADIGDSIVKNSGDYAVKLIKPDTIIEFSYRQYCNENSQYRYTPHYKK